MLEPINLVGSALESGSVLFDWTIDQEPGKIIGYYVVIDEHKPIFFDALNNKMRVILASGRHTINVVSVVAKDGRIGPPLKTLNDDIYNRYGKPSIVSFFMLDGGAVIVRYTPPKSKDEEGQLRVL
jgi:hypothetical protein